MRLGGFIFGEIKSPESWIGALNERGYRAAYCPVTADASDQEIEAYAQAAAAAGIVIAEVGAWSNPLAEDPAVRGLAVEYCKRQLDLAEKIGAQCCVNITGSRGKNWAGPDPRDLTDETFEMIVRVTQEIIDAVRPVRTYFTLETSPWCYPDSTPSYARLISAIGRKAFAVHADLVNLVSSPQRYYQTGALAKEFIGALGPLIKSFHIKDILMEERFSVHLAETPLGSGGFDFHTFLTEANKLGPDVPVMIEHQADDEAYRAAAACLRRVAEQAGVRFI